MSIITTYTNQYKKYIVVGLVILYSYGVWHISSKYTSSSFLSDKVAQANQVIEMQKHDQELANKLGKTLEDSMANMKSTNTIIYRDTQHEIVTHKFYTECVNTPDVVRSIESSIDNKGSTPNK